MFTGIITDLGRVRRLRRGDLLDLTIATAFDTAAIPLGASIACSGACLTVVAVEPGAFSVQASVETLARTTLGQWGVGTPVNLERSLRLGDELGGADRRASIRGRISAFRLRGTARAGAVCRAKGLSRARWSEPDGQ
jgi:riboflavin synthase alpha subunit